MVEADNVRQPDLRHRVVAAAGASVLSALLVNPLDVVKTRVQAASIVTDKPVPTCLLTRFPVRWAQASSLSGSQTKLPASAAGGCMGGGVGYSGAGAESLATHLPRRLLLGQVPMSSCACALKVADLGPERLGAPEGCHNARMYRPVTATGVLRDIVRKEGVTALWRGTDTAMLASIPMVGVYMPLYDYLLQRCAVPLGGFAPLVAGSAARTLAVLLVGPLELVRTRQQGSAGGARTAWAALRETLRDTGAAAGGAAASGGAAGGGAGAALSAVSGGRVVAGGTAAGLSAAGAGTEAAAAGRQAAVSGVSGVLRAAPRMWTGVGATLARDVPFSAIYWGLVERIRSDLLVRWADEQQAPVVGDERPLRIEQHRRPAGPSGRAVFAANMVAGCVAGAVAAVVTTPFDVVKTQLQMGDVRNGGGSGGSGGGRLTGMELARRILRQEGPMGLFRGWGPRAARTAPACAVVVASYEVLKLLV